MKKLNKEDQEKWSEWDWTSVQYFRTEMASYLYEQWGILSRSDRDTHHDGAQARHVRRSTLGMCDGGLMGAEYL